MRDAVDRVLIVKLIRTWSAARVSGDNPLPHLLASAAPYQAKAELAVACHSLLELTEAQLGRPLVTECCCSRTLSRDEVALIGLLLHAKFSGPVTTSGTIPHGLPGAICWAAFAVLRGLRETVGTQELRGLWRPEPGSGCPFGSVAGDVQRAA